MDTPLPSPLTMKKLIISLLVATAIVACSQQQSVEVPTDYNVTGTVDGCADGDTVMMYLVDGLNPPVPTDTAIVKNHRFSFNGKVEGARLQLLVPMHAGEPINVAFFVLEAANISVTFAKHEGERTIIVGGPTQKLYEDYLEADHKYSVKIKAARDVFMDSTATEQELLDAELAIDSIYDARMEFAKREIRNHIPSAFSDLLYSICEPSLSPEDQDELLRVLGELQPQYPAYKAAMARRAKRDSVAAQPSGLSPEAKTAGGTDTTSALP